MTTVVLATVGTLGDLHPFVALATALRARGHRPLIAPGRRMTRRARPAREIEAVAISPAYDSICARMGDTKEDATARIMASQGRLFEELVFRDLTQSTRHLRELCPDAEAIVAFTFVPAGDRNLAAFHQHGVPGFWAKRTELNISARMG